MGVTRAAITTIVNDLIHHNLVREAEDGPATGGRRATMLEINPKLGYVVGIDLGAVHLGILIADFSAQVIDEIEIPFDVKNPPEESLCQLGSLLEQLLEKNGLYLDQIVSIGMGAPGPVVADAGMVSAPLMMPGWDGFPIRANLEQLWGKPVSLNNDAELGALGEWAHGAGRGERNLAYIKVGAGVGAGLLLDGKIYRGATGCAGEIGHIIIQEDGPECSCGNRGCLEAIAGGYAIARKARDAIARGRRTQLSSMAPIEKITAQDVVQAAQLGDLVAQQIMSEAGKYLGIAIASLVNMVNPSMVVVGGSVAQMGDLLLDPIRQTVRGRSLKSAAEAARITAAVLGRRSSAMGAVVQAMNIAMENFTDNSG